MTDCIEWKGGKDQGGYGLVTFRVHRLAYLLGRVPTDFFPENMKGMHVRHTCGNRLCMNPEHLVLGTAKENNQDRVRMGRTHRKLTPEQVLEIRSLWRPRRGGGQSGIKTWSLRWIAKKYGVSSSTIWHLLHGVTY